MDVEEAIETKIEPQLRQSFELSTTRSLLTMATLAYLTTVGGKTLRYRAFVDSLCSDERVTEEWGQAAAAKKAEEWKNLVPLHPETLVTVAPRAPS
ncbi:MAG: hypothetical protein GTO63_12840 [Anaerolineae bacterium]|nr:hypothetical protein [Anaerolineae bacterium]NIN99826.1 hypothetical protein [Anaerolineae bacterium]NIQ78702.1 hypothetical protein [Anaerolineae bacterium]